MADPVVIGESQSVPGAVDVRTPDGTVVPVAPETLSSMGLAPMSGGGASSPAAAVPQDGIDPSLVTSPPPTPSQDLAAGLQMMAQQDAATFQERQLNRSGMSTRPATAVAQDLVQQQQQIRQLSGQPTASGSSLAFDGREVPATRGQGVNPMFREIAREQPLADIRAEEARTGQQLDIQNPANLRFNEPGAAGQGRQLPTSQRPRGRGRAPRLAGPSQAEQNFLGTFDDERRAGERAAAAVERAGGQRSELLTNANVQDALLEQEHRAAEQARQERAQQAERQLEAMRRQVASRRVDPQAFWKSQGEAGRVAAAINVAAGLFAEALGGGKSVAMDILDDAVEKNIAAQQELIGREERALTGAERDLQRLLTGFESQREREAAQRITHWDAVQRQLAAVQAGVDDERMLANLQAADAEIERRKNAAAMQFEQARQQAALQAARRRAAAARRAARQIQLPDGSVMELDPNDPDKYREQVQLLGDMGFNVSGLLPGRAGGESVIPGTRVIDQGAADALNEADLRKAREKVAASRRLMAAIEEMKRVREQAGALGFEVLDRELVERGHQARMEAVRSLSVLEEAGALGDQEREFYMERIPDPTGVSITGTVLGGQDPIAASLEGLSGEARRIANENLRPSGMELDDGATGGGAGGPASFRPAGGQ